MPDLPDALSCTRCVFFEPLPVSGPVDLTTRQISQGVCHRYPPTVTMTQVGLKSMFPQVVAQHWCGEIVVQGPAPTDEPDFDGITTTTDLPTGDQRDADPTLSHWPDGTPRR